MRQAVEAQVLSPHCELGEHGLRQILTDVVEEVRRTLNQDVDGAEILHSLLNASWLQSLLKVYECLQRYLRDSPEPALDYASGLSFQLLIDIKALPGSSEEAKELDRLLRQPHLQALLSAHDTVAQKDYEPVLPPMPADVPDDEEATRIVCLVKNKQPLLCDHLRACSQPPAASNSPRAEISSRWDTLRRLTRQRLHLEGALGWSPHEKCSSVCRVRRGSSPPPETLCPQAVWPRRPPCCTAMSSNSKAMSRCRLCYTNLLWQKNVNHSAPSVYNSVMIDNFIEEIDGRDEDEATSLPVQAPDLSERWTVSPPGLSLPCYANVDHYLHPSLPPKHRSQSPRIHTAPPSPACPQRLVKIPRLPPVELAKQESLDELRSTVQLAASSMESSTKDIKLLGEKMAAATDRMSESVQDNSQALVLFNQVVDRLQMLLTASRTESNARLEKGAKQYGTSRPSVVSSSSSSLSSCPDQPSTSRDTNCLSGACRGSPCSKPKKHPTSHPLNNGILGEPQEASNAVRGSRFDQRKKGRKT
ncbi:uncharacterized protein [Nerophis lumbriciformis]|uniref:uncharacterized protein isoform X1 n=1 Tax=Nerophis lumbriciformis TaxID=546530 RepID=UPI002ADF3A2D|nr:uncharacterized protein LOC133571071 isoform X1 [Nerophis lumbriciformis]